MPVQADAIILAAAGLIRLGLPQRWSAKRQDRSDIVVPVVPSVIRSVVGRLSAGVRGWPSVSCNRPRRKRRWRRYNQTGGMPLFSPCLKFHQPAIPRHFPL